MKSVLTSAGGRVMGPMLQRVITAPSVLKSASGASTPNRSDSVGPERRRSFLASVGLGNLTPTRRQPSQTSTASGGWTQDPGTPQSAATPKSQVGNHSNVISMEPGSPKITIRLVKIGRSARALSHAGQLIQKPNWPTSAKV